MPTGRKRSRPKKKRALKRTVRRKAAKKALSNKRPLKKKRAAKKKTKKPSGKRRDDGEKKKTKTDQALEVLQLDQVAPEKKDGAEKGAVGPVVPVVPNVGLLYDLDMNKEELDVVIEEVNEKLRTIHANVLCCVCQKNIEWRMFLRQCVHFARIPCPVPDCHRRIHENDIDALLNNPSYDLNMFMSSEERKSLLTAHHLHTVEYALGNDSTQAACPQCNIPYPLEPGCHYVQCVHKKCKTWFCSGCKQPAQDFWHFSTGGKCLIGSTDVYRISYLLRMLLTTPVFGLILIAPGFFCTILILLPLSIAFMFTTTIIKRISHCLNNIWATTAITILIGWVILLIGFVLGVLTIPFSIIVVLLYAQLVVFRCVPTKLLVTIAMSIVTRVLTALGIGSVVETVSNVRHAKLMVKVDQYQEEQEKSEELHPDKMTKLDAKLKRIYQEDREAHRQTAEFVDNLKKMGDFKDSTAV
ncbi:unnamed protein product [Bursaphelenchus okinawaensis]|uniref:IBR domain-containing protein n=1 Tax=Bursaphelenchus okinawaensis TaxID=465554 RepID=A0A811JWN7_9BILA|nr:unnamed protein product [Bursaphelenchus okinawaensis]CAG9086308.1 unnamed protein product [Bursaphelenchus okinawaensis]